MAVREGADKTPALSGLATAMGGPLSYLPLGVLALAAMVYLATALRGQKPPTAMEGASVLHETRLREKAANRAKAGEPSQPSGTPNVSLVWAVNHMKGSVWAEENTADDAAIIRELIDKLYLRELSAYGRIGHGGPPGMILWKLWASLTLDINTGNAFIPGGAPMYFDIQFDRDYVRSLWPQPRSWMGV